MELWFWTYGRFLPKIHVAVVVVNLSIGAAGRIVNRGAISGNQEGPVAFGGGGRAVGSGGGSLAALDASDCSAGWLREC